MRYYSDDREIREWMKHIDDEINDHMNDMSTHGIPVESGLSTISLTRGDLMILGIIAHRYMEDYHYEEGDIDDWSDELNQYIMKIANENKED